MGACANAPMAAINDYYYEDLTPESFETLLDDFAAGKTPKPGSAIGRQGSAPEGGATTLTDAEALRRLARPRRSSHPEPAREAVAPPKKTWGVQVR